MSDENQNNTNNVDPALVEFANQMLQQAQKHSLGKREIKNHVLLIDGNRHLYIPFIFNDSDEKLQLVGMIYHLIQELGVPSYVVVSDAWVSINPAYADLAPRNDPNRQEALMVSVTNSSGSFVLSSNYERDNKDRIKRFHPAIQMDQQGRLSELLVPNHPAYKPRSELPKQLLAQFERLKQTWEKANKTH